MKRRTYLLAGLASLAVLSAALAYEPVKPLSSDKAPAPAANPGSPVVSTKATTPADAREEEVEIMRRLLQSALEQQHQRALPGRIKSIAFSPDGQFVIYTVDRVIGPNDLVVLSTASWTESWRAPLESRPHAIAVTADGKLAAIAGDHMFAASSAQAKERKEANVSHVE